MNIMKLLKNASKIESMMKEAQEELESTVITGEAGAGAVKVTMNAKHMIRGIDIDDEIYKDKEIAMELLIGALNNASEQIETITKSKLMNAGDMFGDVMDSGDAK